MPTDTTTRQWTWANPEWTARPRSRGCTIDGCPGRHVARGLCRTHYDQWKRGKIPSAPALVRGPRLPIQGLTSRDLVEQTGATYRQIDYWTRTGRISATIPANGSGSSRGYDPSIVPRIKAILALTKLAIPDTDGPPWTVTVDDVQFTIERAAS